MVAECTNPECGAPLADSDVTRAGRCRYCGDYVLLTKPPQQLELPLVGYLYFMRDQEGLIKIGRSVRPRERREQVCWDRGQEVELLGVVYKGGELEQRVHELFDDLRVFGEWFRPSDNLTRFVEATVGRGQQALVAAMEAERWLTTDTS